MMFELVAEQLMILDHEHITCVVKAINLPPDISTWSNPRNPKITHKQALQMQKTLREDTGMQFWERNNGGITIAAQEVEREGNTFFLEIPDGNRSYGVINGGHTALAIKHIQATTPNCKSLVQVNIFVGCEERIAEIAKARNLSMPLKNATLLDFEECYKELVAYLNNTEIQHILINLQIGENNPDGKISINKLLKIVLTMYPPLYVNRNKNSSDWVHRGDIKSMTKILPSLFEQVPATFIHLMPESLIFSDFVQSRWSRYTQQSLRQSQNILLKTRWERMKSPTQRTFPLYYLNSETDCEVPGADLCLFVGSFRANIHAVNGEYQFRVPLRELADKVGPNVMYRIGQCLKEGLDTNHPKTIEACYREVEAAVIEQEEIIAQEIAAKENTIQ